MASEKWLKGLKKLSSQPASPGASQRLFDEMAAEKNDRGAALIAATLVEEALRRAIVSRFVASDAAELFKRETALSSFYNLTAIGYGMGIFDNHIRSDLDRVREIRNAFAHCRFPLTFDTAEIADACLGFDTGSLRYKQIPDSQADAGGRRGYHTAICARR